MIAATQRNSAALIVNPSAGRLSPAERDRVIEAFPSDVALTVYETAERGEGRARAEEARADGNDVVIAFGGDGLVNDVANALAGTSTAMGIIPGGTMNVFARALHIPLEREAAVERALTGGVHRVNLGWTNDRYFTFSAGCGFDAEAAGLVEAHQSNKRRFGEIYFYWSAARVLAGSYRHRGPAMTLTGPFGQVPVSMAVANNAGPYAYFMKRPVRLAPQVELEKGLDVFALKRMRIEALPFYAFRAAIVGDVSKHRDAFYAHDLQHFEITAEEPFSRHVDGEPLEAATHARFELRPESLTVVA